VLFFIKVDEKIDYMQCVARAIDKPVGRLHNVCNVRAQLYKTVTDALTASVQHMRVDKNSWERHTRATMRLCIALQALLKRLMAQ
jgi:hypothetical protein